MLTSKQRAQLRAMANTIDPVIIVGKGGITENVVTQVTDALTARELIKGKVLESALLTARETCDALAEACGAEPVQCIGSKFVLYKRNPKDAKIQLVPEKKKKMRIAVFGGSFNPPHKGHLNSACYAAEQLMPDKFLIVPAFVPPHKELDANSPTPAQRMDLCRLNFADVPNVEISDIEISRGGKSYTSDTLRQLQEEYPGAEFVLLLGTDMLQTLHHWHEAEYILETATIAPFQRSPRDMEIIQTESMKLGAAYGARVEIIESEPLPASSTDIRETLKQGGGRELLTDPVYAAIVRQRLYGVKVDLEWLREKSYAMLKPKRIPHVQGCEAEAVRLAERWGADPRKAAVAAILHDCTKKQSLPEQLALCREYGILTDAVECQSEKLLHARTGTALAHREFGVEPDVAMAIRWHTTGKPDMTLLEKILYMADYIEPTRDFPGVERLRELAYTDLDAALLLGLEMSLEDVRSQGNRIHQNTLDAWKWYKERSTEI